jgi:choline dehydrogenase-like flavoprotein
MADRTDVCVIGSGFGGSILAYYLARAGQKVVVLERGPRIRTPDLQLDLDPKQLLQIVTTFNGNGMIALAGTGVGGGSIVYSGASLRAPRFVFERTHEGRRIWPQALSRPSLDPFYRRAERGLGVRQLGFDEVGKRGGTWAARMNRLGLRVDPIRQATTRCVHCGFCNTGCRFFRKNHLTLNYLLGAEEAGAEIRPDTEATTIEPADGGYRVRFGPRDDSSLTQPSAPPPSQQQEIHATRVVCGGGTIGTAGLLLRSRPFLSNLSDQVGRNLSANGDLSLAAILPDDRSLPGAGRPRQHQGVAMDTVCYEYLESHGFIIITQHLLPNAALLQDDGRGAGQWFGLQKKRTMRRYADRMIGLAVIGVDGSPGTIHPAPGDQTAITPAFGVGAIDFPIEGETNELFSNARTIVRDLVERMGGEFLDLSLNPAPTHPETAYSAHPLGTARLADTPELGVADADGEVFGHPGLYVADGAAVPTALGVNPSLTIAAVAERIARRLVRKLGGRLAPPPDPNPFVHERGSRSRHSKETS